MTFLKNIFLITSIRIKDIRPNPISRHFEAVQMTYTLLKPDIINSYSSPNLPYHFLRINTKPTDIT